MDNLFTPCLLSTTSEQKHSSPMIIQASLKKSCQDLCSLSTQAGSGPHSAGSCGHEGEGRPRHGAPDPTDVPEVLPRAATGQLPAVCSEGGGGGEEGEHGSGAGLPHVLQI